MTTKEAKENIIKNFRANYTNDHQSTHDIEVFLLNAMEQLESIVEKTVITRAVKIIEEYEVAKQPLCEQNTLLFTIKSRIKSN